MKIKKLMPMEAESRRLIDWGGERLFYLFIFWTCDSDNFVLSFLIHICFFMFIGVYDALQKKYLKTLLFCVYETFEGPTVEEYACKML